MTAWIVVTVVMIMFVSTGNSWGHFHDVLATSLASTHSLNLWMEML